MSKTAKKPEKGNRNITDFFVRRPSIGTPSSQMTSSQPSLSQPTPSQRSGLKPGLKRKNVLTKTTVVNISSSDSDPADDKAIRGHTSRTHATGFRDSAGVVAGPSSATTKPKTSVAKKASAPPRPIIPPSISQSSAKTTVKRRMKSNMTVLTASSSTKPVVRKKRKVDWDDSTDDEMFKPDPSAMKAELARAPVPRFPAPSAKGRKTLPSEGAPSSPSGRSASSKRRRVSTTNTRRLADHTSGDEGDIEEVPGSFSDEHDLVLPDKKGSGLKAKNVNASVDKWRRETSVLTVDDEPTPPLTDSPLTSPSERSPTPELAPLHTDQVGEDPTMDIDMTEAADLLQGTQPRHGSDVEVSQQIIAEDYESSLSSLTSVLSDLDPATPAALASPEPEAWATRPATPPPPDELPPMPPTPVALDVATKTAQTIARIKAAAEAAAREHLDSSDGQIELGDLSDSDSEAFNFNAKPARKSTPPSKPEGTPSSPLTAMDASSEPGQPEAGPSTRYNFRHRSSPSDKRGRSSSPDDDAHTSRRPPPKKKSTANPLDKLLREKDRNAKAGKGIDGIRLAEAAMHDQDLASKNKGKMREEMDQEEDSDDEMWADEEAAARTARQGAQRLKLSPKDDADDSDSDGEDNELDIAEATKHLGDEQGAAVGKILDKDRKGWLRKGKSKKKGKKGLVLWADPATDAESVMDEDPRLPFLPLDQDKIKSDRILNLLQTAVESNDVVRLGGLLSTNLLSRSSETHRPQLVSWLFSLQLFPNFTVSERAHGILLALCDRSSVQCAFAEPFVSALARLGAKADILTNCGLQHFADVDSDLSSTASREDILARMIRVVKTFARHGLIVPQNVPDLIMALMLVGFDPSTDAELRTEIVVAIEAVGSRMPSSADEYSDMEPALGSRLLEFAKQMTPANKAYIFDFLCGGCPQMGRVKRWLAHALLLSTDAMKPEPYSMLPSLEPFLEMLMPVSGSKTLFDVAGGMEEDDYFDNLLHYVAIFNAALSDVPAYVHEEKRVSGSATIGGRPASPEKPKTELQQIKHCLDVIHGKIVDTRAAHLDRSRVKAALQQLAFRVHYQREATLKAGRRPGGLRAYFPVPVPVPVPKPLP